MTGCLRRDERGLASGALVRVLPEGWGEEWGAHAIYLPSRVLPARVRAFVSFLQKEAFPLLAAHPGVSPG